MISDQIDDKLQGICGATQRHELKWRPIDEYLKYYDDNLDLSERLLMLKKNEFTVLHSESSFFVRKNNSYLIVLSYCEENPMDGTTNEICELLATIYPSSPLIKIPPYMDGGIERIRDVIQTYWDLKEGNYSLEVSDMFDLLDNFS